MREGFELAEAVRALNSATARLVALIGGVITSASWNGRGLHSAEQWVASRCGLSAGRARRLVMIARHLPDLPTTEAAFQSGELSEDQVALLCAHACGDGEGVALTRGRTVAELRRALADHRPCGDPPARRRVAFGHAEDGSWRLWAELPPDEGGIVERALVAAREPNGDWAGALIALAERPANSGKRRGGATVLLHVRIEEDGPHGHLHLGPAVPERLRRYMCCDGRIRAVFESDGRAVSVGRELRIVPERTRIVVEERDRGCRVPGCDRTKWLQIHHVIHWEDGGPTDTWNLVALCHAHHRLHHLGRLQISGDADDPDGLTFGDHRGGRLAAAAAA